MPASTPSLPEARTIKSVAEAINALADDGLMRDIRPDSNAKRGDGAFGMWFRGHAKVSYELTPSILRESHRQSGRYVDEMSLVRHFKAMNPTAASEQATDFDWLVTMQHYLAPTRLLDWTENLLVALYFAVRDERLDGDEDAALWLLNARRLNLHASATTRISELAFPSDPDVIARSMLCRVRERLEWHDAFVREMSLMRIDRADYRINRIREAIATAAKDAKNGKPVKLDGSEVNDAQAIQRDLRDYSVGRGHKINLYEKSSFAQAEGIYTRLRLPLAVYPGRTNSRIRSQAGVFTLHGGKHVHNPQTYPSGKSFSTPIGVPISLIELNAGCQRGCILKWLRIPKDCRADIRRTLALVGVTDATLFPELDYQSKYLLARWTSDVGSGDNEEE